MPEVVVIAGPNAAGKSTVAEQVIGRTLGVAEFVNADVIARGLSGFSPDAAALQAGRIMLARLAELAGARHDFAFETTLASRGFAPMLRAWQQEGYQFHLVFIWLPDADMAADRVRGRVARGGHNIPPEVIRRRYQRGLHNLFNLYLPIADSWRVLDNSGPGAARLIAERQQGRTVEIAEPTIWNALRGLYMQTTRPGDQGPPHVAEPPSADNLTARIVAAATEAVRAAIREHKLLGFPIVVWQDGRSTWIPPEEIQL